MPARPLIALLTDFGTRDAYVGVMKGVMRSICPDADFIDITHDIPPQDVRAAAFTLRNSYRYFPEGTVFLVVVDPGVGTDRRAIYVRTKHHAFVAPDNGVLSYALSTTGSAMPWRDGELVHHNTKDKITSVLEIAAIPYFKPRGKNSSYTFHGRDVFAPQAARAACGRSADPPPTDFLRRIKTESLQTLLMPQLATTGDDITGEVLYIDHFGNLITSIGDLTWKGNTANLIFDPALRPELPQLSVPATASVSLCDTTLPRIHRTYGEVETGKLLALVGSSGYLEISTNGGNAANRLNAQVGDTVTIHIPEGA